MTALKATCVGRKASDFDLRVSGPHLGKAEPWLGVPSKKDCPRYRRSLALADALN